MGRMTDQLGVAEGRPFTVADLETMPDDGRKYEVIDGMLFVSPSPIHLHQRMAFRLAMALDAGCPSDLEVVIAPFNVQAAPDTVVQPDVLVARQSDFSHAKAKSLTVAPLLTAEVLSRSTHLYDRNIKMAHYATLGVPSYWLLSPGEPGKIEIFELADGDYRLTAVAEGEESVAVERPFPITVCPARLIERRAP